MLFFLLSDNVSSAFLFPLLQIDERSVIAAFRVKYTHALLFYHWARQKKNLRTNFSYVFFQPLYLLICSLGSITTTSDNKKETFLLTTPQKEHTKE